jgi:hypothetical protein
VVYCSTIDQYFGCENLYKKNDPIQIQFVEDLVLFVTKGMKFCLL